MIDINNLKISVEEVRTALDSFDDITSQDKLTDTLAAACYSILATLNNDLNTNGIGNGSRYTRACLDTTLQYGFVLGLLVAEREMETKKRLNKQQTKLESKVVLTIETIAIHIDLFGVFCYAPKLWSDNNDKVFAEAERLYVHPDVAINEKYLLVKGKN